MEVTGHESQAGGNSPRMPSRLRVRLILCALSVLGLAATAGVLMAPTPGAALEILIDRSASPDLVITDLGLPKLGSWELVRHIRAAEPHLPIIVASGYFDPDAMSEMDKTGADLFVQKPYRPDEVLGRIRELLDGVLKTH